MMIVQLKNQLLKNGWHLSDEGIEICQEAINYTKTTTTTYEDIVKAALDIDLATIGVKALPDDINKGKLSEFSGPCVLQVVKVRNISAPKANEESSYAPRLLQVHLTDGHRTCAGIEHANLGNKINLDTPPGSKICLIGCIKLQNGFLLLDAKSMTFIGGKVENIYNKWKAAKEAGGFSRSITDVDEAPPPFVPFGNKIMYKCNTNELALHNQDKQDEENKEFVEQRHAAIAEVKKSMAENTGKSFSSGKSKMINESNAPLRKEDPKFNRRKITDQRSNSYRGYDKTGNFAVDESFCSRLVQMGFTRQSVIDALRRFNNNLDNAVEHLLNYSGNNKQRSSDSSKFPKQERNDNHRDRRKGGRGRSSKYDQNGNEDQRHSASATLFDFVETKMSSKSKVETEDRPGTSAGPSTSTHTLDDDALQEEYILEYVRELSLVETHGCSDYVPANDTSDTQESNEKSENRGVAKYRGKGGSEQHKGQRQSKGPRRENAAVDRQRDRPPQQRRNDGQYWDGDGARDTTKTSARNGYSNQDHRDNNRGNNRYRGNDERIYRRRDAGDYQEGVSGYKGDEEGRRSPRKPNYRKSHADRQIEIPPRFQKQHMQQGRQPYVPSNRSGATSEHRGDIGERRGKTLADTAPQVPTEDTAWLPNQQKDPFFYPVYKEKSPSRQKPGSSHSYQDQRQQNRGNVEFGRSKTNDWAPNDWTPNNDHVKETWAPGMRCIAKYWEDEMFYEAVIENVHCTEPTAVVCFIEYGNSEEVFLTDLKPLKNSRAAYSIKDNGTYQGSIAGLEFTRGHKGPTRYPRRDREKRPPNRPPQAIYQAPAPK